MRATHDRLPIHPRRLWYWVAGCLLAGAATCVILGVVGFFGLHQQIQDFQRVRVPGHAVISFTQPGGYVLYIERPGSCCSSSTIGSGSGTAGGNGPPFPNWSMRVALVPVAGGSPVSIRTWRGATESYAAAGRQGQAAMYFTIDHPGQYYLAATNVTPRTITDIAAGRGIGRGVLIQVLLALAGIFVLTPAGLLVGGITAVRRRRARRVLLAAPWAMQPGFGTLPGSAGWQPAPAPPHGSQISGDAGRGWQAPGYGPSQLELPSPVPSIPASPYQPFAPADSSGTAPPPSPMQSASPMPALPASAEAPPASTDRTRPPRWSRRRTKLLFVLAGGGIAILMTTFLIHALAAHAPASRPSTAAPATRVSTSAPSASTQAPPATTAPSAPLTTSQRWLHGLKSLQTHMTDAMGVGNSVVTAASLRVEASQLRRCSPDLARLGPPPAQLRSEYRMALQACAGFEQGARCAAAAARAFAGFDPTSTKPDAKLTRLFHCSDAGVNRGSELISMAVANASFTG